MQVGAFSADCCKRCIRFVVFSDCFAVISKNKPSGGTFVWKVRKADEVDGCRSTGIACAAVKNPATRLLGRAATPQRRQPADKKVLEWRADFDQQPCLVRLVCILWVVLGVSATIQIILCREPGGPAAVRLALLHSMRECGQSAQFSR